MKSRADEVLGEVTKACQNPLLVAIGAMSPSPQQAAKLAEKLGLSKEEIRLARWVAILKRDCQTLFGQDFLTILQEICMKKERKTMRTKEEIWATITDLINSAHGDSFEFFKKFQAEFQGKCDSELNTVLDKLKKERMQVFDPCRDYDPPCKCHPEPPIENGWSATAKIAHYDHNNLFKVLLIAELLKKPSVIERFYNQYLRQLQVSATWIVDHDDHLLKLYDFIAKIDNHPLLSKVAKIAVEIHPQRVYFACKDGKILDPEFFTYVKKRLLEIQGLDHAKFYAGARGDDPELLTMIEEYQKNLPPPKKKVVPTIIITKL